MLMVVTCIGGVMMTGCGASADTTDKTETKTETSEGAAVEHVYYDYTKMTTTDAGITYNTGDELTVFGDGTYMLTTQMTIDVAEASNGYLNYVGCKKVSFGACSYSDEDGDSTYELEAPDRVIYSDFMMTGPGDTTEIYVDSADKDTYANYSPKDISSMSEQDVIDLLLKTNYKGEEDDSATVYSSVVVNENTFMIEDIY